MPRYVVVYYRTLFLTLGFSCGVVGPFKTSEEAEQYAKNNRPLLPADTKVVELTRPAAREK